MAIMHPRTREQEAARYARDQREREALAKAEREKTRLLDPEVEERKLLAVLAEFAPVEPPPEISPDEAPAEVVKRLEALERRQPLNGTPPRPPRGDLAQRRNRCIDALQRIRNEKAAEAQSERNREHLKRCGKEIKALEQRIAGLESKQGAEEERHRGVMGELKAERTAFAEKLAELNRSLPPDETSEQRLERVMT